MLLLNTTLTVQPDDLVSHIDVWYDFTKELLTELSDGITGKIFVFWGTGLQQYKKYVCSTYHYIMESPHPSAELISTSSKPVGFLGSKVFSKINTIIEGNNGYHYKIKW